MRPVAALLTIILAASFLAPFSRGHCGHWVVKYPECEDLTFIFCDGNFTECGNTSEVRLAGNCTMEECDPNADDVIIALNGTGGDHSDHDGHGSGGQSDGSMATSAGSSRYELYSLVSVLTCFLWLGLGTLPVIYG